MPYVSQLTETISLNKKTELSQYMGALKNFESPDYAHGYISRNL